MSPRNPCTPAFLRLTTSSKLLSCMAHTAPVLRLIHPNISCVPYDNSCWYTRGLVISLYRLLSSFQTIICTSFPPLTTGWAYCPNTTTEVFVFFYSRTHHSQEGFHYTRVPRHHP
ncbi:hypothetical protein BDZ89DRAFT_207410 [Hymenopellis radicata]|nr:hypothetical protein BDZ89DRAFT_207410 [Hymenopellis radicata]